MVRIVLALLLLTWLCSCGDDRRRGNDAGTSTDGAVGVDAGVAPSACPADPPAEGTVCDRALPCQYLRCPDVGAVAAQCVGGTWTVDVTPCTGFECFAETCGPDQLCLDLSGGAEFGECVDNPCGVAPIACDCLDAVCATRGNECSYVGGRTFRCAPACGECP